MARREQNQQYDNMNKLIGELKSQQINRNQIELYN